LGQCRGWSKLLKSAKYRGQIHLKSTSNVITSKSSSAINKIGDTVDSWSTPFYVSVVFRDDGSSCEIYQEPKSGIET
jgi:hypothetical protein